MIPLTANRRLRLSLRGVLAWGLLAAAGFWMVRPIVTAVAPLMEGVVDALQSDYVSYLTVEDAREGPKLVMSCRANRPLQFAPDRLVPVGRSFACAETDAVHVLVPVVIFLTVVVGWPIANRREMTLRGGGALLVLPAIIAATTPVLLVGLVNVGLHPETYSTAAQFATLLHPFVFIEMGGVWLLPLIAAALCIRLGAVRPPSVPPSNP
jgi:hypothetical protein